VQVFRAIPRRLVPALALVLTAAAIPGTSAITAGPPEGSAGIGDAYFPLDGNGGINVLSYDVRDRYDFRKRRLTGVTTLTIKAEQALSRFNLDILLPVRDVRIDGARVAFKKPHQHELRITPDSLIPTNERFKVRVKYAGRPGSFSYAGERNWLASRHEVVTMNEPHMAPWWFASNDHPLDKATYDIRITTERGREVISNGRRVSRKVNGGLATTHWRSGQPMASYLAFFAAGDFTVRRGKTGGIPWLLAVSRRLPDRERSASMNAMQASGKVTVWLQKQLGDYPFGSTGGLVTSLRPGFALENQTRPTYPALTNDARSLVVHELAHQWFGDSVSVHGWRDIWLNEGFATYMEARYDETHGGRTTTQWLEREYEQLDDAGDFWNVPIDDPGKNRIFSFPIYVRGGMTLAALRRVIGTSDFNELLRTWVAERRFGNATTEQFADLAEEVSGANLDAFFDAWLRADDPPAETAANGLG
jgi:aminopeptidase N